MFYEKSYFDQRVLNGFQCFITVCDIFTQLSVFFCCLTVFVIFKHIIQAIEAFREDFGQKNLFLSKTFFLIFRQKKHS